MTAAAQTESTWAESVAAPMLAAVLASMGATAAATLTGWPDWAAALVGIAGAGLGALAVLDHRTQLVLDRHNLTFLLVSVLGVGAAWAVTGDPMTLVFGLCSGAFAMVFFLVLAVVADTTGGGDVKLVASPAMLMGAFQPLTAVLWMFFLFAISVAITVTLRIRAARSDTQMAARRPMVPLMVPAMLLAIPTVGLYLGWLGLI